MRSDENGVDRHFEVAVQTDTTASDIYFLVCRKRLPGPRSGIMPYNMVTDRLPIRCCECPSRSSDIHGNFSRNISAIGHLQI